MPNPVQLALLVAVVILVAACTALAPTGAEPIGTKPEASAGTGDERASAGAMATG